MVRGLRISVVIPTHNEHDGLEAVLAVMPTYVDEVLVVDWKSTDGTQDIARRHDVTLLEEPRQGYGRAYHTGVPAATGDVVGV